MVVHSPTLHPPPANENSETAIVHHCPQRARERQEHASELGPRRKVLRRRTLQVSHVPVDVPERPGAALPERTGPLRDDPFGRLHPARILRAGPGLFAATATPPGPAIQRYAGKPWPAAGFDD